MIRYLDLVTQGCPVCRAVTERDAALQRVERLEREVIALEKELRWVHELGVVHCGGQIDADRAKEWADKLAALTAGQEG